MWLLWGFIIKHIQPPLLMVLFINLCFTKTADGKPKFGNYEGYIKAYQGIGIAIVVLTLLLFSGGTLFPDLYNNTLKQEIRDEVNKLNGIGVAAAEEVEKEEEIPEKAVEEERA